MRDEHGKLVYPRSQADMKEWSFGARVRMEEHWLARGRLAARMQARARASRGLFGRLVFAWIVLVVLGVLCGHPGPRSSDVLPHSSEPMRRQGVGHGGLYVSPR